MAALILEHVPCVIIEYKGRKKVGTASTSKFLELELNLVDHVEAMEAIFPHLEQRLGGIAAKEGGPEDMLSKSKVLDVSLVIVAAADKKSEVLRFEVLKVKSKYKLQVGAKAETLLMRFKGVGSLAGKDLPRVDDYTGVDVLATIKTLQADGFADGGKGGGTKNKSTRKTTIELANGDKAAAE